MRFFWVNTIQLKLKYLVSLAFLTIFIVEGYYFIGNNLEQKAIQTMSWVLANKVIVIDPGHGGYDPGKIGVTGTKEKDINLAIAQELAQYMKNAGTVVVLTRDEDEDLLNEGSGSKKQRDLDSRLAIIDKVHADLYVGIQANSFGSVWRGAQTFYNVKNNSGKLLAQGIQKELKRQLKNTHRKAAKMDDSSSYMLRKLNNIPSAIVEAGFLSNREEEELLKDQTYQKKVAFAIYCGVVKYFCTDNGTVVNP
ncbi:N-acetylmuramoyl-L-alanine amidase [Bacillota bacterium LX-D]|nr:N-acetylmuramoyl-L-alanine amidase [Bacillota bacterium LX-D]